MGKKIKKTLQSQDSDSEDGDAPEEIADGATKEVMEDQTEKKEVKEERRNKKERKEWRQEKKEKKALAKKVKYEAENPGHGNESVEVIVSDDEPAVV